MNPSVVAFRSFVARLMKCEGALVEETDPVGLDFIAPDSLQQALGIPEEGRLGFAADLPPGAIRVHFESDWIEKAALVMGDRGRYQMRVLDAPLPALAHSDQLLQRALVLQNAVYRFIQVFPAWSRYLIVTFRYAAVSDEKREGLVQMGVNLSTGSPLDDMLEVLPAALALRSSPPDTALPAEPLPPLWEKQKLNRWLDVGLTTRIRRQLEPFLKSLQRRLERDVARIHEYHDALYQESQKRALRQPADSEKEDRRQEAIQQEYLAKASDLQQKYALKIEVRWLQTLQIILPVQRFQLLLKRRKGERSFHLDWNPLVRRLETPPCEYSYTAEPGRMLCDDTLHMIHPTAHAACRNCSKPYCRVCHPDQCPHCHVA